MQASQLLSSLSAEPRDKRMAFGAACISLAVFILIGALRAGATRPSRRLHTAYQSALVLADLATAALLFGQWHVSRSRAVAILAAGYLFTAVITVAHTLTFPGLFAPTGLLGAGEQSTAWIYMFWHGAFPLSLSDTRRPTGQ